MEKLFNENLYLILIILIALILPFLFLKLLHPLLKKVIEKKNKKLFNNLVNVRFFYTLAYIVTPLFILLTITNANLLNSELAKIIELIKKISGIWIIISLAVLINKFLNAINTTFKKNEFFLKYPINSYLQLVKLVIIIITAIFAACLALNLSPWGILSGVGALGAILILIFKDTILGLIASIQVYGGKLLQEGDWIELKDLNIDGEVMEVGLHRVKVKAWDNTITTFPTSKFLDLTFKNWRGMEDSGGRRIKRKIIISLPSIKFLDEALQTKFSSLALLETYLKEKKVELDKANIKKKNGNINKRTLTNIGCFRAYIKKYLEQHPELRKDMTMLVRQLPIEQFGLPIEIYTFTSTTKWKDYENIQSDIFDHILASASYFELELYQEPSSNDIKRIFKKYN
jgi:miniconductance mechanosensitive channel